MPLLLLTSATSRVPFSFWALFFERPHSTLSSLLYHRIPFILLDELCVRVILARSPTPDFASSLGFGSQGLHHTSLLLCLQSAIPLLGESHNQVLPLHMSVLHPLAPFACCRARRDQQSLSPQNMPARDYTNSAPSKIVTKLNNLYALLKRVDSQPRPRSHGSSRWSWQAAVYPDEQRRRDPKATWDSQDGSRWRRLDGCSGEGARPSCCCWK